VGRLWGVGPKTEAALHAIAIRTIGDLADRDPAALDHQIPGALGLWELARGIDPRGVEPDRGAKSVGSEDTFDADVRGKETLRPFIHAQALRVGRRLRRAGVRARVVQLKIKLADFTLVTRRATLPEPSDDGQALYRAALVLLDRYDLRGAVRLTGVSGQEIQMTSPQLSLLCAPPTRSERLNAALDRIADRYGGQAVVPADLAGGPEPDD
jgi:DNA polymerase-4